MRHLLASLLSVAAMSTACGDPVAPSLENVTVVASEAVYARPGIVFVGIENHSDVELLYGPCGIGLQQRVGDAWQSLVISGCPLHETVLPAGSSGRYGVELRVDAEVGEYRVAVGLRTESGLNLLVPSNPFTVE